MWLIAVGYLLLPQPQAAEYTRALLHGAFRASDNGLFDLTLHLHFTSIHTELDALPLDYQTESWLSLDHFNPASEVLRFGFTNKGSETITTKTFLLEKQERDAWQPVGEADASDLAIAPRVTTRYTIDLTRIPGGQEPGQYRVSATLEAGGKTLQMKHQYQIDGDATEISYPLLPKMTAENEDYCNRYVTMWGFYSPFKDDFDEESYLREFHTYHLYYIMAYTEGRTEEYQKAYGADVPAEVVEGTIMRHFLFTEDQILAQTATKAQSGSEYYEPATNTYHFEGGYGGGSLSAVVTDSYREGDLLTLTCDWYGMDDDYHFSQELTVRLGKGEYDFVYVAGRMLETK